MVTEFKKNMVVAIGGNPAGAGADGASAYEVAVANGFVGTEAQWLASLVGPAGADGATGPPGKNGDGSGALLIDNRLNEYAADPVAQEQARNNLGITPSTEAPEYIDGGSF